MANELKPCPVCGKKPKISIGGFCEAGFSRYRCVVECTPFLRKPHLKVEEVWYSAEGAENIAVNEWNRSVENG